MAQPVRRRLHVYTRTAVCFALAGLALNVLVFFSLSRRSAFFVTLAMDNIFLNGFCVLAVLGLGTHALLKMRWPGDTVFERHHRPRNLDIAALAAAFAVTAVNASAVYFFITILATQSPD